jgi:hypothetical protein
VLPENSSGKDDETMKMIHNNTTAKQGEDPNKHGTTTTEALEYIDTDKLDPTTGSILGMCDGDTFSNKSQYIYIDEGGERSGTTELRQIASFCV